MILVLVLLSIEVVRKFTSYFLHLNYLEKSLKESKRRGGWKGRRDEEEREISEDRVVEGEMFPEK